MVAQRNSEAQETIRDDMSQSRYDVNGFQLVMTCRALHAGLVQDGASEVVDVKEEV